MSAPFIGEIRAWATPFAPTNWAFCNGQKLQVNQFQALFSIIAGLYGPTDNVTFFLPDLRSRSPMDAGNPKTSGVTQGLPTSIPVGTKLGDAAISLTGVQMPAHTHQAVAAVIPDNTSMTSGPTATSFVSRPTTPVGGGSAIYASWNNTTATPDTAMDPHTIGLQGQSLPHENRQLFLAVNFCIALQGEYPMKE